MQLDWEVNRIKNKNVLINVAWTRNGNSVVTGEALLLAVLMHTHGGSAREGDQYNVVRKLMKDINLDK